MSKPLLKTSPPGVLQLLQALGSIDQRFTSGNAVPVEKASVPAAEWEAVKSALVASFPNLFTRS